MNKIFLGEFNYFFLLFFLFRKVMKKQGNVKAELQSCLLLNMSSFETTEKSNRFVVTLYNPLSHKVD